MAKYELTDFVPMNDMSMITIIGFLGIHYKTLGNNEGATTWKELLLQAKYDFECPVPVMIIIEQPLQGNIYQFGNSDNTYVYDHGNTFGYA